MSRNKELTVADIFVWNIYKVTILYLKGQAEAIKISPF